MDNVTINGIEYIPKKNDSEFGKTDEQLLNKAHQDYAHSEASTETEEQLYERTRVW